MTRKPTAVPTVLTRLWRTPDTLREGDGVVIVFADGRERNGIVMSAEGDTAVVSLPGGSVRAEIDWENQET